MFAPFFLQENDTCEIGILYTKNNNIKAEAFG